MRPNLREEGLVDRETDSSALHVAQSHAHPRHLLPLPARYGPRRQRLRARGRPTEPLGRCIVSSSRVRISAKYVPQQRRFRGRLRNLPYTFAIRLISSQFALYYALGKLEKGGGQVSE